MENSEMGPSSLCKVFLQVLDCKALCLGKTLILEGEINPFMRKLQDHGITVTAVHNHWLFDSPRLMYMHFALVDYPVSFAEKIATHYVY